MKIKMELGISYTEETKEVDISEYGMTKETWDKMTRFEKEEWLHENIVANFDTPSWCIDYFEEI